MARSEDIKTPLARFAFTGDLFKPRTSDSGRQTYGCTLLFPKGTDISALQNAALKACIDEWGDKAKQWIKDEVIKSPFLDGDGKQAIVKKTGERLTGFAGHTFLRVSSGPEYPPRLFDAKVVPIARSSEKDDDCPLYSGVYGYAVINAYTWEHPQNGKGVTFSVSMVQVTKPGERLGGGGPDPDKFLKAETVPDEGEAPAETKTGAGAAGFFG